MKPIITTHDITISEGDITLRPMVDNDMENILLKWNNDAEVLYFSEGDDITSHDLEGIQYIYGMVSGMGFCFVIEYEGTPIGECWLQKMNLEHILAAYPNLDTRRIDLMIGEKDYWGRGIGTKVVRMLTKFGFESQNADMIFYMPADFNIRSCKLAERLGYKLVSKTPTEGSTKSKFDMNYAITRADYACGQPLKSAPEPHLFDGLIPAIVQDHHTGRVLMLAYVNRESYDFMLRHGQTCFWSRSKQELWHKGATSGNVQKIKHMAFDCDNDTLLIQVEQTGGGACHTGSFSCFGDENGRFNILDKVSATIKQRSQNPVEKSYTNYLLDKGVDKICKKVGEEAAETIIAAKNRNNDELTEEISDLLYHLLVLMHEQGVPLGDIQAKLAERYAPGPSLRT